MKKLVTSLSTLVICLSILTANAQQKELTISSKVNTDKSVTLTADKSSPGTYTVVLNFTNLTNSNNLGEPVYKIKYGNDNFLTLKPNNKDQAISYSYSYSYIRGELKPKYNNQFLYTLPYTNGKKVRVAESGFVNAAYFGSSTPEDWKAYRFYTDQADTVTAVRKGVVVKVADLFNQEENGVQYTSKVNEVIIEHVDGTLATYRGFKKGILVKEGQMVFPGTALGVNSMQNERYNISLMITYLKSADFEGLRNRSMKDGKSFYGFITPFFCTVENANDILTTQKYYTPLITPEIIQKEMTKKEIKNLEKK